MIRTLDLELEDLTWNSFSATYNLCDLITYIKRVVALASVAQLVRASFYN